MWVKCVGKIANARHWLMWYVDNSVESVDKIYEYSKAVHSPKRGKAR